ncbi:MAG TPA: PorP/SprF family type IX secretion system membrane protein [Bacteroidia bacterium]|jgi:type IX secretion system PorP/SprF family membrane protein|nr:PorP/SprF family type IX secretion system membrane protein [Bacteroidia bacterium]
MRKLFLIISVVFAAQQELSAQQWFNMSGYPSLLFHYNPAYTGTRGNIDARLAYRKQWTGFESAPVTQVAAVNSRLWKGRIGVGGIFSKDVTGPTTRSEYDLSAAYHLHFPDVEFCAGFSVDFLKYFVDASQMTTHWTADPAVLTAVDDFAKARNTNVGVMLYNDRFHFGLACMTIINNHMEFFETDSSSGKVFIQPHYYFTCGYNFNANPDYVWENNLMVTYVSGLPMTIDYNLRVHYREHLIVGTAWRLKDAIEVQVGCTFLDNFQVMYSYDLGINKLRKGHDGSHEIMLGYRYNFGDKHGGYKNFGLFQHQRYNLF